MIIAIGDTNHHIETAKPYNDIKTIGPIEEWWELCIEIRLPGYSRSIHHGWRDVSDTSYLNFGETIQVDGRGIFSSHDKYFCTIWIADCYVERDRNAVCEDPIAVRIMMHKG